MISKQRATLLVAISITILISQISYVYQAVAQNQNSVPGSSNALEGLPTKTNPPTHIPDLPAPVTEVTIPDETEVYLSTIDALSSKTLKTGDLVNLRVDEDVVVDGRIVIQAGTRARAEIAEARKSGFFGKSGKLALKVLSTTSVDGAKVPLLAGKGDQGGGNLGASVAVFALVSPLGFLIKGHSANIPAGSKIRAIVDGRTKVLISEK